MNMKLRLKLSFIAAALPVLAGATAFADPVYDFSATPSSMPSSSSWIYTSGGISITASGYATPGGSAMALFTKLDGPGETGLGFVDGGPENEISSANFMQLDVSNLLFNGITSLTVGIGSLQTGEQAIFSLSSVSGQLGATPIDTLTGGPVEQGYTVSLVPGVDFIDITGGGPNSSSGAASGDVVLETASAHFSAVPDQGSTALLTCLGLLGLCCLARSRRTA